MKLQVFGPGCKNCEQLYANAVSAAESLSAGGVSIAVEKVKDLDAMYRMGVFVTPTLAIDEEVTASGKVLSVEQIEEQIKKRLGDR